MIVKDIDVNKLKSLFKEYKENYIITSNNFTHNLCYVIDNEIIGFIIYSSLDENIDIIDVFVKKEYRNNGYAFKMLSELIKEKNKTITLEVNINNKVAIELYKKLGFEIISVRKKYYNGTDGYLMQKK